MLRPIAYLLLNDLDDKEANDLRMKMLDKNNPEKLNHNDMVLVEAIYERYGTITDYLFENKEHIFELFTSLILELTEYNQSK